MCLSCSLLSQLSFEVVDVGIVRVQAPENLADRNVRYSEHMARHNLLIPPLQELICVLVGTLISSLFEEINNIVIAAREVNALSLVLPLLRSCQSKEKLDIVSVSLE